VSTPRGMNAFGKKRFSGAVKVFTIRWWEDPSKNPQWLTGKQPDENDWYEYQVERFGYDEVLVAQELGIDYNASVEGVFIKSEWVQAAVDFDLPLEGDRVGGFDVAGGGKNESVYVLRVGCTAMMPFAIKYRSETEATWKVVDRAEGDNVGLLNYDANGIGHTVLGLLKNSDRAIKFRVNGINSNETPSEMLIEDEGRTWKEKFRNKRAVMWWNIRTRCRKTFEHRKGIRHYPASELISLPNDEVLISQLSAPLEKHTTGGKILVESKKEMKTRGVDSPDRADALVYAFADYNAGEHVVDSFDYTDKAGQVKYLDIDHERPGGEQYAVIFQDEDRSVSFLAIMWWPGRQLVQVYAEFVLANASAKEVVALARDIMHPGLKPIREWIANDEMFEGMEEVKHAPWFEYRREKVALHRNYSNDYRGAIMLANRMFSAGMIEVDESCERLVYQLANWTDKNNPGLARCLCQVVTRLRKKKVLKPDRMKPKRPYKGEARFARTATDPETGYHDYLALREIAHMER